LRAIKPLVSAPASALFVEELLLEPNARVKAYVVQAIIRTMFQEYISGVRDHGDRLWGAPDLRIVAADF